MDPIQDRRAMDFIRRIERDVERVQKSNGYTLKKRKSGRRCRNIGYVRYNIAKDNEGLYTVYVHGQRETFSDPQQRFVNNQASDYQGWHYIFDPDDENAMRYAVSVLESSYDQK